MKVRMVRLLLATCGGMFFLLGLFFVGIIPSNDAAAYAPPGSQKSIPNAAFHLWEFSEIFSCPDGSIQFIEMVTTQPGQQFLQTHELKATNLSASQTHSFIFPNNLPGDSANKSFLIATANFGSLAGGVAPDYVIPANFLFTEGGSIELVGADTLNYGAGQLPLDGTNSLSATGTISLNSPTNFAGQTGSIICPPVLAVSKQAPPSVASGSLLTYTLTVTASGTTTQTTVILTDTIPAGTSFVSADVAPVGGVLTWALGEMASPLSVISRTFVVSVTAPVGSVVTNATYGVRSDQTSAVGQAVQVAVIDPNTSVFLPIILKVAGTVDEHAADLVD